MGRPYRDELGELAASSQQAAGTSGKLERAIVSTSAQPLVIVASGGAQIAARWMARLHLSIFGQPASVVTPLEAISLNSPRGAAIWLISQGGRHPDIRSAATWAVENSPLNTYGLIGQADTALAKLIDAHGGLSCSLELAPGADGFLTTNGLWAMLCALTRAYGRHATREGARVDEPMPTEAILNWARGNAAAVAASTIRDVVAAIGDPWTVIGAEDLQIRCTEASLANVWVADYRNLGHGRHFWLTDRQRETTCLFLTSKDYVALDAWTRLELPNELATVAIDVPFEGSLAGLASVAFSMHLTAKLGERRGRDPGKPGVPAFGERLYAGDYRVVPARERLQ